ncbi:MAG: DUF1987 domain-containing protein [Bacteroidales bacterium]|nr:DUF1987 domain-containing protein [Bacteroidales bacterium]
MTQTERSPLVTFDGRELVIKGRSFMDNAIEFYRNLIARIGSLEFSSLDVSVHLNYFNTSSSKCLLELFRTLERINRTGKPVSVFWYYTDGFSDMEEAGEDYRDLMEGLKFELVEVDEE